MGRLREFECASCGYRVEVSGGEDRGMQLATTTILCEICKELYDVVISNDAVSRKPDREIPIRCPKLSNHPWKLWSNPGPCPKCGTILKRGKETLLWD